MSISPRLDNEFEEYWTDMQNGLDDGQRDNIDIYDFVECAFEAGARAAIEISKDEIIKLRTALEAVARSPLWVDEEMVKRALK